MTEVQEAPAKGNGVVSHKTLAEALAAAQSELPAVEPDMVNPHFKSKFVSLGHLLAKVRPVLNRHGLSVIQMPSRGEDLAPTLTTTLLHVSGETLTADAPLLLPKQDPQGQGSAITYMRRYALAAILAISDQEDDDGVAGSKTEAKKPSGKVTKAQREKLRDICAQRKLTGPTIRKLLKEAGGVEKVEDLPKTKVDALKAALMEAPEGS